MRRVLSLLVICVTALSMSGCSADKQAQTGSLTAAAVSSPVPEAVAPAPARGQVVQGAGPFDDRFTLAGLALADGKVTGELDITSDVSEILVLEMHVAYYDAAGTLLGRQTQIERGEDHAAAVGVPDETVSVSILAPTRYRAAVSSALLTVPVLVNE